MSDRIWIWFADNGNIRKWQHEPFPEGTEYVVAAQADAELEEMTRSCLAERAGAASLRSKLEEAEGALEPFALVAEYDIGDSESDEDIFRPMDGRNSIAGLVRVGHLRAARRTLSSLREADHA